MIDESFKVPVNYVLSFLVTRTSRFKQFVKCLVGGKCSRNVGRILFFLLVFYFCIYMSISSKPIWKLYTEIKQYSLLNLLEDKKRCPVRPLDEAKAT